MSLALHSKYIYDSSGKVVEVVLPIYEFIELNRRAGDALSDLPKLLDNRLETREELSASEMTQIALQGNAFEWLKDEPDIYSDADGEPV